MKTFGILLLLTFFCATGYCQEAGKKVFITTVGPDGVQRVSVSAGEYFFGPNYIIVKVHIPVEMTVKKTSGFVPHNIVIDSPGADIVINEPIGKEQTIVKFTPGKTGKYPFYCTKKLLFFKSHREKGMEGILEVIE